MSTRNYLNKIIWVFGFVFLIGLTACGDYSISLPNGYSLVRIYPGAVLIKHPHDGIAIEANIDGYKVIGDLVIGHSAAVELPPEKEFSKPGFFILNTRTHETLQSLDRSAWIYNIKRQGITEVPVLHKPSRFD